MSKKGFGLGKFLVGIGIGAGLGALLTSKSGEENRKELKIQIDKFKETLKDIDVNEIKDEFLNKIEDIRNQLEDLDKEKAAKIAKEKGKELRKNVDGLVELAKEKGTPILEETSNNIRKQAIDLTKKILNKLEETK